MRLAHDQHVVEALSTDAAQKSLAERVRTGRPATSSAFDLARSSTAPVTGARPGGRVADFTASASAFHQLETASRALAKSFLRIHVHLRAIVDLIVAARVTRVELSA